MLPLSRELIPRLVAQTCGRIQSIQVASISSSVPRFAADDWLHTVGPYPRTQQERERAAKKYNLIPEDYEPYEEGEALGDYPKLKPIGAFNRDPYDDFDDPVDMRFYGEVFHRDADLYHWERIDPMAGKRPEEIPQWKKVALFGVVALIVPAIITIFRTFDISINHPHKMRKPEPNRLPFDQKYYEFPGEGNAHGGH